MQNNADLKKKLCQMQLILNTHSSLSWYGFKIPSPQVLDFGKRTGAVKTDWSISRETYFGGTGSLLLTSSAFWETGRFLQELY